MGLHEFQGCLSTPNRLPRCTGRRVALPVPTCGVLKESFGFRGLGV